MRSRSFLLARHLLALVECQCNAILFHCLGSSVIDFNASNSVSRRTRHERITVDRAVLFPDVQWKCFKWRGEGAIRRETAGEREKCFFDLVESEKDDDNDDTVAVDVPQRERMAYSRKRDVLERYRTLLENNLVLTDELFRSLREKKVFPDFVFNDIKVRISSLFVHRRTRPLFLVQALPTPIERNRKLLTSVVDNGDAAFNRLVEGLIAHGQPFLGELLESEGNLRRCRHRFVFRFTFPDRRASDPIIDTSEQIIIDDDMLKKCPGMDKIRPETREKLKTYLQTQVGLGAYGAIAYSCSLALESLSQRWMERSESRKIGRTDQSQTAALPKSTGADGQLG